MKKKNLHTGLFLCLILCFLWAFSQEPECDDPPLANFPIPAGLLPYCAKSPEFTYDLMISTWDMATHHSTDIRISDSLDTFAPEQPRFMFDTAGNRFYTKLYAKFLNNGGGLVCPNSPNTGPAKVSFYYKETGNPDDVDNEAIPWQPIGDYIMNITTADGVLYPFTIHNQQKAVCWKMPAPRVKFPTQFILKAELSWDYDDDLSNNIAYSLYDLSPLKREAQIALSLDLSGSMNTNYSGSNTRLDIAKQKAMLFANLVEPGNYLGIYSFATGNTTGAYASTSFTADYIGTDDNPYTVTLGDTAEVSAMGEVTGDINDLFTIFGHIAAQTHHGCTPVGQGLLRAKEGLESISSSSALTPSKAIVIFSDGMQNIAPFVGTSPGYTCGGASYTNIDAEKTFKDNGITIYSIFFDSSLGFGYNMMNDIQNQTGGDFVYGTATELDLAAVYFAIRGMVDDMVYLKEKGVTSLKGPWPQFEINFDDAVKEATVAVAWELGNGETEVTIDRRQKGNTQWIEYHDPFNTPTLMEANNNPNIQRSFKVFRFVPGINTTWEFRVRQLSRNENQTPYTAAVFADTVYAQIKASLDNVGFATGKPLPMYVDLRAGGYPVINANVNATVRVPTRSFSSTLRNYYKRFRPGTDPDTNRSTSILQQLKKFLKEEEKSDQIYVYKDVPVTLSDNGMGADKVKGDGIYSGMLTGDNTHIAGDYQVTFTATGALPSGKTFERSTKLSALCNVGPVDINKSGLEMSISQPQKDGSRLATITILPTDSYGNAAFPGSAGKIKIKTSQGTLIGGVVDNQDSSFTQQIALKPGETADVEVFFGGESLGMISAEKPFLRHEFSLHAGIASPEGSFKKLVSSGACLAFDYTYRLNHNFGIRSELGLNWFNNRFNGNLLLFNFNAYLQYRYLTGRVVPYFEMGPGFYKLENSSSALGYGAGVGAQYILSRQWNIDLNVHGHRVGGTLDLNFIQVLAGFIFKF